MTSTTRIFAFVLTICIAVLSSVDAVELRGAQLFHRELHPRTRRRNQVLTNGLKMASAPRSAPTPAAPPDVPRDADSNPVVKVQRSKVGGGRMKMMRKRGGNGNGATRIAGNGTMMNGGMKAARKRKRSSNAPSDNDEGDINALESPIDVETFGELGPEGDELRVGEQSGAPSDYPSMAPSPAPTSTPSEVPTASPTDAPTDYPTENPTALLSASSSGSLTWPPTITYYPTSTLTSDE